MESRHRKDKGTSAVEFVLILPLLLLVLFLIIEFSFVLYDKAVITNASREGARRGIVAQNPRATRDQITAVVDAYCASNLISFATTTAAPNTTVDGAPCGTSNNDLTVTVAYQYTFLVLPNFLSSLTGAIDLNGVTVMRCE